MVLDLIHVQNFDYLTVAWEKMSLFLELIWAHLCIRLNGLDDNTLIAEAKYLINFTQPKKKICVKSTL